MQLPQPYFSYKTLTNPPVAALPISTKSASSQIKAYLKVQESLVVVTEVDEEEEGLEEEEDGEMEKENQKHNGKVYEVSDSVLDQLRVMSENVLITSSSSSSAKKSANKGEGNKLMSLSDMIYSNSNEVEEEEVTGVKPDSEITSITTEKETKDKENDSSLNKKKRKKIEDEEEEEVGTTTLEGKSTKKSKKEKSEKKAKKTKKDVEA